MVLCATADPTEVRLVRDEVLIDSTQLVFAASTFAAAITVGYQGVDDLEVDGDKPTKIKFNVTSSNVKYQLRWSFTVSRLYIHASRRH